MWGRPCEVAFLPQLLQQGPGFLLGFGGFHQGFEVFEDEGSAAEEAVGGIQGERGAVGGRQQLGGEGIGGDKRHGVQAFNDGAHILGAELDRKSVV